MKDKTGARHDLVISGSRAWVRACTLFVLSLVLLFMQPTTALSEGVQVSEVKVQFATEMPDAGWYVSASFRMDLGQRLEDAVNRGLPLIFVSEVELSRPRWYWFDEKSLTHAQVYRLSYNALTQQYRVSVGAINQRFETLQEAISMISNISRLRIAGRGDLKAGSQYEVSVRLRLDTSQLPKPFQVNAMTNREWTLGSEWRRLAFTANPDATP